MKYPTSEQVEQADHEQLSRWYRFLPVGTNEYGLQIANRVFVRLNEKGGITPEISKKIGW